MCRISQADKTVVLTVPVYPSLCDFVQDSSVSFRMLRVKIVSIMSDFNWRPFVTSFRVFVVNIVVLEVLNQSSLP
jgi:hypothetical protein